MTMNRLSLVLGGLVLAAVLCVGGIALGDVLADEPDTAGAAAPVTTRPIPAAAPADGIDVPEPGAEPVWPAPSPLQIVEPTATDSPPADDDATAAVGLTAAEIAALADPDTGIDSDATGEPFIPPTSPAFDPDTDEVDPEAPAVPADGVEVIEPDDVEDLLTPTPPPAEPEATFTDPCADPAAPEPADGETTDDAATEDESGCPDGTGGTIVLLGGDGDPVEPLWIMRQLYTSISVPLELRCSPLGTQADGSLRAIFASNNPGTFTIRYWPSTEPDAVRTVTYETPESERDRWLERRLAGEPTGASMHTGIHNCPEMPGVFPGRHTTFQVHGVDDLGTEHEVNIYFTPEANREGVAVGRPHASFTPVDQRLGLVTVPYAERTEEVYVASLPRDGARATTQSCTDIENDVLARRHRSDLSLLDSSITEFPRTEGDGYEPGIDSSVVTRFVGEEGTTYEICTWVAKPPRRSFDKPPVVLRDSITVRAPRHHRVRIWFGGGHSDVPLETDGLTIRATNWGWGSGDRWPTEPVRAGAFFLDEPVLLADSGSSPVPSTTLLGVTGPEGDELEMSIPTPTNCAIGIFGCVREGFDQYDVPIPGGRVGSGLCGSGFGGCDPPTSEVFLGNIRLIVETYTGPAGPPDPGLFGDPWAVQPQTAFAPSGGFAPPPEPQIDQNQSALSVIAPAGDGRPGMQAVLWFDRPVSVTATPRVVLGGECPVPAVAQTTAAPTIQATFRFPDLCWGAMYALDLIATDADGNVLDLRGVVDGVPNGRRGYGYIDMPKVHVESFRTQVTVHEIAGGLGASRAQLTVAGAHTWDLTPDGTARCLADGEPRDLGIVRNAGGRPIAMSDPVIVTLDLRARGDGRSCGDRDQRTDYDTMWASIPLDRFLSGEPVTVRFTADDGTDVEVEIRDVIRGVGTFP